MESTDKHERKVKGIWIPIEIWEDKNLSWNEKILFLEIDSFTSKDKDCYISNEYISNLLGICETSANKVLSSLISKGYVVKTSFDGRRRYVKSSLQFTTSQGCSEEQGCIALNSNIPNIYNNTCTDNKKEDNKLSSKKAEALEFVERMYSIYPTKCPLRGVSLGKTHKDKDRLLKLLKTYSMDEIERVITHEVEEKLGKSYMSKFATFLNNFPDPKCIEQDLFSNNAEQPIEDNSKLDFNGQIYR